jgi:hypothetical protein
VWKKSAALEKKLFIFVIGNCSQGAEKFPTSWKISRKIRENSQKTGKILSRPRIFFPNSEETTDTRKNVSDHPK